MAEPDSAHLLDRIAAEAEDVAADRARGTTDGVQVASIEEEPPAAHLRAGDSREGVHPRGRHLSGQSLAALAHRRWRRSSSAAALYDILCAANPAPFAALAQWQGVSILSSSPERLVRISGDRRVETRPIAGTRPRSRQPGRRCWPR